MTVEEQVQDVLKKVEALGAQIVGFSTQLGGFIIRLDAYDKKLTDLGVNVSELNDLQEDVEGLTGKLKQLTADAFKVVKTPILEPKKVKLSDLEPVEHGDKTYRWGYAAFNVPGIEGKVKATEAATDTSIIKTILAIPGQQILIEQA